MEYKLKAQMLVTSAERHVLIETNKPNRPDYVGKLGKHDDLTTDAYSGYFTLKKAINLDDINDIVPFIKSEEGSTIRIQLENLVAVTEL